MQYKFIITSLGLLLGLGCQNVSSQEPQTSDKHHEQVQPENPLTIQIGDKTVSAPAAVLGVRFYSSGAKEVQLEFEASDGSEASLVAVADYRLVESRRAELPLGGGATGEHANLTLKRADQSAGKLALSLSEGGQLSGSVEGGKDAFTFFGKFVVSCSVPAKALGVKAEETPTPSSEGAGEVLVVDSDFRSEQCQQVKRTLKL